MRRIGGFVGAVIATYLVAVLAYSQLNLANLVEMGVAVDAGMRVEVALHDLGGMVQLYLPLITVALALGFLVAAQPL